MQYEQKEIPIGSGNFYWYGRWREGGKQKSRYFGKELPQSAILETQQKYELDEADRKIAHQRLALEEKIRQLSVQLAQLK